MNNKMYKGYRIHYVIIYLIGAYFCCHVSGFFPLAQHSKPAAVAFEKSSNQGASSQQALAPTSQNSLISKIPALTVASYRQHALPSPLRRITSIRFEEDEDWVSESLVVMDKVIVIPFGISSIDS